MIEITGLMASDETIERNRKRPEYGSNGRCVLCDAPIKNSAKAKAVLMHDGGATIVTDAEYDAANADPDRVAGQMGTQYIGSECFRKHKAVLGPYA